MINHHSGSHAWLDRKNGHNRPDKRKNHRNRKRSGYSSFLYRRKGSWCKALLWLNDSWYWTLITDTYPHFHDWAPSPALRPLIGKARYGFKIASYRHDIWFQQRWVFRKGFKICRIDALIIKGVADEPVYISIQDDDIDICAAKNLWGENVRKCTEELSKEGSVACIGRAGELLVPMANVMNDISMHAGAAGLARSWFKKTKGCCCKRKPETGISEWEKVWKRPKWALRLG